MGGPVKGIKKMDFETWKNAVIKLLKEKNIVNLTHNNSAEDLFRDRGDEPEGCWELKDSPETYVEFLKDEYKIYGPDGE
jgi:hypothetical protein